MIYLDNYATTPMDPRVRDAMIPYLKCKYGNPASRTHGKGWEAERAVDAARDRIASFINASPNQIIFTSGATESNNTVLKNSSYKHIITSTIEHSSVFNTCGFLDGNSCKVSYISSDQYGQIIVSDLSKHKCPDLVSFMLVNNEIGTIQNIGEIRQIMPNVLIHSDMAQALGKIPIDVKMLDIDFASFSGHKIYGPKGIGVLYARDIDLIEPLLHGGVHEFGLRAGTLNVPGIVGFGMACEILENEMCDDQIKIAANKEIFEDTLTKLLPDSYVCNFPKKISGSSNIFIKCNGIDMLLSILSDRVGMSLASACTSLDNEPSRTLLEVGVPNEEINNFVRVSIGKFNKEYEMERAALDISEAVKLTNQEIRKL
jgi:cysteine desulfurase